MHPKLFAPLNHFTVAWPSVRLALAAVAVAALAAGCGRRDGPPRFDVAGAVTWNGAPVQHGRIVFEPDSAAGNSGPQGFALIEGGRYDTASTGEGTIGGPHVAIIHGYDGTPLNDDAPFGRPLFGEQRQPRDLPRARAANVDFALGPPAR